MLLCWRLALICVAGAAVQPACERANGSMNTPFVIIPTFDMPVDDLGFMRSTLAKQNCVAMATDTQDFLDSVTGVKDASDRNATSFGVVVSDAGTTRMVQFANAILAAPNDYFSGIKIILVERNSFFSALMSGAMPPSSLNETEDLVGTFMTNKVIKAELTAQKIRRIFLGKEGDSLHSGSLLAKLHPLIASTQYCQLFCFLGGHNRHHRHADQADLGEFSGRPFRQSDSLKMTSHLDTWNGVYRFLGVLQDNTVASIDPRTCSSDKAPLEVISGAFGANATQFRNWTQSRSSSWSPLLNSTSPECSKVHTSRTHSRLKFLSSVSRQRSLHSEGHQNSSLRALKLVATVYTPLLSASLRKVVSDLRPDSTLNDAGHNILGALRESMRIRNSGDGMDNTGVQRDFFLRHTKMKSSSFIDFPDAPDKFCRDNSDPLHVGPPSKTAVCFVGVTRTMNRPDVSESFLYRFLAGWGLRSLSLFAVLVKTDSTSQHADVYTQLSRFNTIATEWYHDTLTEDAKGNKCPDNNEVKQLKQWSRCMTMIEAHEQRTNTLFDAVVKIRPDDLWYGAMPPYCTLNLKTNAYISRQQKRWSDQWFALPRNLAEVFFHAVRTGLRPYCHYQRRPLVNCSKVRKSGSPPFEEMIFDFLKSQASKNNIHVTGLILPRILTRQKLKEEETAKTSKHPASAKNVKDMCQRFKWYLGSEDCQRMVMGTKKYIPTLSSDTTE